MSNVKLRFERVMQSKCVKYARHTYFVLIGASSLIKSDGHVISICEYSHHSNPIVSFHRSHCHGGLCREKLESVPEQCEIVHDNDVVVEEYPGVKIRNRVLQEEPGRGAELEPVHHLLQTVRVVHLH